jgi:hypothetical protein
VYIQYFEPNVVDSSTTFDAVDFARNEALGDSSSYAADVNGEFWALSHPETNKSSIAAHYTSCFIPQGGREAGYSIFQPRMCPSESLVVHSPAIWRRLWVVVSQQSSRKQTRPRTWS